MRHVRAEAMLGRAKAKAKEGSLTPVGVNFLLVGYAYSDGGLSTSDSSPIEDAQLTMHTEILAYARSLDVWGKSGSPTAIAQQTSRFFVRGYGTGTIITPRAADAFEVASMSLYGRVNHVLLRFAMLLARPRRLRPRWP